MTLRTVARIPLSLPQKVRLRQIQTSFPCSSPPGHPQAKPIDLLGCGRGRHREFLRRDDAERRRPVEPNRAHPL
jgi:hypothetical protein